MPDNPTREHTDNCGRTGSSPLMSCKMDCSCWCHKAPERPQGEPEAVTRIRELPFLNDGWHANERTLLAHIDHLTDRVRELERDKARLDSQTIELTLYGTRMVIEHVNLRERIDAALSKEPATEGKA